MSEYSIIFDGKSTMRYFVDEKEVSLDEFRAAGGTLMIGVGYPEKEPWRWRAPDGRLLEVPKDLERLVRWIASFGDDPPGDIKLLANDAMAKIDARR